MVRIRIRDRISMRRANLEILNSFDFRVRLFLRDVLAERQILDKMKCSSGLVLSSRV